LATTERGQNQTENPPTVDDTPPPAHPTAPDGDPAQALANGDRPGAHGPAAQGRQGEEALVAVGAQPGEDHEDDRRRVPVDRGHNVAVLHHQFLPIEREGDGNGTEPQGAAPPEPGAGERGQRAGRGGGRGFLFGGHNDRRREHFLAPNAR
jgi:hypothetical protein